MGVELDALALLDGGRMWTQGAWFDPVSGRMCLDGALEQASGWNRHENFHRRGPVWALMGTPEYTAQYESYRAAHRRVRSAIQKLYRPKQHLGDVSITSWNDELSPSKFKKVKAVLLEAARMALAELPPPPAVDPDPAPGNPPMSLDKHVQERELVSSS